MEIGKIYKILGESSSHRPDLDPQGTIVKCIEDKGNNFFVVKLVDRYGKEIYNFKCDAIEEEISGWLVDINKIDYEEIKYKEMEIASADKFDSYIKKRKELEDHMLERDVKNLIERINYKLNSGLFELDKNKISFNVDGIYDDNTKSIVIGLLKENGWKYISMERDKKTVLYYTNIILKK